ncbi:MAG: urea ABC transporter permease subunit UrtB [Acidiferrobacterales bacterium]|nr:urea ABC transporter permease subunit UrtB [Acidiferrobacterales bacterium]
MLRRHNGVSFARKSAVLIILWSMFAAVNIAIAQTNINQVETITGGETTIVQATEVSEAAVLPAQFEVEEPSADGEPSADREPSADGEPSAIEIEEPSIAIQSPMTIDAVIQQLVANSLSDVPDVITQIENTRATDEDSRKGLAALSNLLAGELYFVDSDETLVRAVVNQDKTFSLYNLYDETLIDAATAKGDITKVRTSNKVRRLLRVAIAKISLQAGSTSQRIASIQSLMQDVTEENLVLLKDASITSTNPKVQNKLKEAIALGELRSDDEFVRLEAIDNLAGSLEPTVKNALVAIIKDDPSAAIQSKATNVLNAIDTKIEMYGYLERIFFGLSLGSILLLVAAGLAITFGVMGVINMAHGELIMLGAYTTYVVQLVMPNYIEYSLLVAIPAAFIVSGLFGIAIERGVIQFLKGRPLETLLATFGISLILQQLVRTVFSPLNRQVVSPEFMSGALQINPVFSLTYNRLYILLFALIVFLLLQLLMKKTSLGLYVRAVSQNRNMARSMGIRSEWVDAMTFGLGAGVAGLAGVALSQITNVGPNLGQAYIIDSFMVVVFGGVGNLWGTLVGAFTVGALNKFLEPVTGTVLATIFVLVFIILFIQKKPRGLFPQKGRAAES